MPHSKLPALLVLVLFGAASSGCLVGMRVPVGPAPAPAPVAHPGAMNDDADDEDDEIPAHQAAPRAALPPESVPTPEAVERELAPHGKWVDTPDYGRVWVPAAAADPDWQPYTDGSWVYTSWGWSFSPVVPWGWLAFHYGRWGFGPLGWFWEPGYVWGPAWVSWRIGPGYHCWSALGPRGYRYGHHWRGWVTAPAHSIGQPVRAHRISGARASPIVRSARPITRGGGAGHWGSPGSHYRNGASSGGTRSSSGGGHSTSSGPRVHGGGKHSGGGHRK